MRRYDAWLQDFPSFLEGLSLRHSYALEIVNDYREDFPSFLEGLSLRHSVWKTAPVKMFLFPFLFGRAFIEAAGPKSTTARTFNFPSFLEGLSLRRPSRQKGLSKLFISLPFWKGFH